MCRNARLGLFNLNGIVLARFTVFFIQYSLSTQKDEKKLKWISHWILKTTFPQIRLVNNKIKNKRRMDYDINIRTPIDK